MKINKILFDELENIDVNEKNLIKFIFSEIDKNIDDRTVQDNILEKIDCILEDADGVK